ncbi:MAG: carbohydrate-binding domain-containing protein [Cyclobacteriaceae bacterium]
MLKSKMMSTVNSRSVYQVSGLILLFFITQLQAAAQIGPLIWEDNFNTLNSAVWTPDIGDGCNIGLCGWGNQELQSYQAANAYIASVPGEPGNNALVLEAKNENAGSRAFTSGKVTSQGNLSIHYGLVEVRVRVPNLANGLWPAAWMLGANNLPWPAKGEIDIMEMGFSQAGRTQQQEPNSTVNNYVGANAFFATEGGGVGNIAFDVNYNQPYVANTPLNDRFVTYRIYWEPTQLRFTVIDNGTEYDLYTNPLPIDPDGVTGAFSKPFYMLLNLAVGGTLPGTLSNNQVTAPLPGKMYVDYVRVYEYNGHGSVAFDYDQLTAENGTFGVFTDQTPTNNELTFGADGEIFVWGGTLEDGTTAPIEGNNVIAWKSTTANSWFGGGIVATSGKDMSNFTEDGSLKFRIKIPGNVGFRIGITDNFTNQKWIDFPAGQTQYGLVRNGNWGQVEIPLADFTGLLAFQDIGYMFAISSIDGAFPSSIFELAIDDIVWDDGKGASPPVVSAINVTPANTSLSVGQTTQFQASATDQFGAPISTSFNWTASGGTITSGGLYTATTPGSYTVTAASSGVNATATVTVTATGVSIPGTIEAEDYDDYFDTSSGNTGGAYRTDDVDIQNAADASGIYNVGWIASGEWLEYDINSTTTSGNYDVTFRVASPNGNGRFHLEIDGTNATGTLAVPNTGGWQNYTDVTAEDVAIPQGARTMRIVFDNSGLNLNFIDLQEAVTTGTGGGCSELAANGDYTVNFADSPSGPTVTFVPTANGTGNPTCILYYSTNQNATYPGYLVSPNTPVNLNASNGQTVYLYYTYSVPQGGERNTAANPHSFTVGSCGNQTSARQDINGADLAIEKSVDKPGFAVYPNPADAELTVTLSSANSYENLVIYNTQGQQVIRKVLGDESQVKILTDVLEGGIYLLELSGTHGKAVQKIIIK